MTFFAPGHNIKNRHHDSRQQRHRRGAGVSTFSTRTRTSRALKKAMNANVLTAALSIHPGWSRQCDPIKNFADKKVGLNRGQIFANDLIVEPQTKLASRVAWGFKLNDDPLD